jgi:hypothetical protein
MKKVFALSLLLFAGAASASHAGVNFSVNLGGGYYHCRPSYYCAPPVVYYAPPVVYYEPAPVYYVSEPYYAYSAPVVRYRSGGTRIVYRHGPYR